MPGSVFSSLDWQRWLRGPAHVSALRGGKWGRLIEGEGWHEVERAGGDVFRWAAPGARIELAASRSVWQALDLDVEPGPGLKGAALELDLMSETGECVASLAVTGRELVHLTVPVSESAPAVYTLAPRGEVVSLPDDPRLLAYRLFALTASPPLASPGVRFGAGWHAYEKDGCSFRWAANGAAIAVRAPRVCPVLNADLEPGPGTGQRPFRIDIANAAGERVFTTSIRTREWIHANLPLETGEVANFTLWVDKDMLASVPGDARELALRAFAITLD